jgi:2-succinyl-5-enolpyruvyl-6-hydroxy-3-cyclohexene-1-carboxylate synthase
VTGPDASVAAGVAVVAALIESGVRHVVLSPGSRSAPLARALAQAERDGLVALHVRVDERSAGFVALGIAKASGTPTAVACTSGTAVANLLPAVVEARYGGVPVVVLTADRPPELRGRGASQTIDQVDIFGTFPLASRDLPVPQDSDWPVRMVTDLVNTAARARGPVHLNLPFRPPLVGQLPPAPAASAPAAVAAPVPATVSDVPPRPNLGQVPARGAILVGDLDVWDDATRDQVGALAAHLGWPIVAEASSGLLGLVGPDVIPGATALLGDPSVRERLTADMVISVGPFGLDRGVMAWLRGAGRHVAVRLRPRTDPPDPLGTAEVVLDAVPVAQVGSVEPEWREAWRPLPVPQVDSWGIDAVAATVWAQLSPYDLLLVASSTSIRSLAAVARGPGPQVMANRGANGIDGLVSTAWGAAVAWQGGRTVALLGDLAFLHDTNGLLVPQVEPRPDLTFVIADNNGGGIFSGLEQGEPQYADTFERVFGTPHDCDLTAVLASHGWPAVRVTDRDQLHAALGAGGSAAIVADLPPR